MTHLTELELKKMYNEFLDETKADWVKNYNGGVLMREVDLVGYNVGLDDYADSLSRDGYTVEGYDG